MGATLPNGDEPSNKLDPLIDVLTDLAMIRTSFDTVALFAPEDSIRIELLDLIEDARRNLANHIQSLAVLAPRDVVRQLKTSGEGFRSSAVTLTTKGYPRRTLDSLMKMDVFCAVAAADGHTNCEGLLYVFELNQPISPEALASLPALEIFQIFVMDILQSAEDPGCYVSKDLFDRHVSQKFIAFLFAHFVGNDPFFYGGGESGSGSGSGVPRRPITPHRTGSAAKSFPTTPDDGLEH